MARIIAEAAVRLVVDRKGLGASLRRELRAAVREAVSNGGLFDGIDRDAEQSSRRVRSRWEATFNGIRGALGGLLGGMASIGRFLLIGTAAAGALAAITSLTVGLGALVGAAAQASGVLGLLPAALAGFVAVSTTVKLGVSGLAESFKALGSGDMAAFEESLQKLAPSAREFARAVRDIKPGFDQMKLDVQQRMFEGFGDALRTISGNYLPLLNGLFTDIAGSINTAGLSFADFLNEAETVGQVGNLFDNIKLAVSNLTPAVGSLSQAFLTITEVGSRFLPQLTAGFSAMAERFSNFIDRAAGTGQLEAFFANAIEALKTLGRIVGNVFGALKNVMDAARASGSGLLTNIEAITQSFQDWTGSFEGQEALTGFFESMRRVVAALGPPFFELITVIGRDFIPILADIASILGPVLRPLFEVFGRLLQALRPLIDALARAFGKVLEAMGPFFDALATAIEGAMPTLGPIIEDIGAALAELVTAMIPLAPLFVELLEAVLPILPPFIRMIAEIMPSLIDLIRALMPIVQALADLFIAIMPIISAVANVILTVLVPVIEFIATVIGGVVSLITGLIQGIWNVITTVFTAIRDFIVWIWNGIGDFFGGIIDGIVSFFEDGIGGLPAKVGQWFSDIWTKITTALGNIVSGVGDAIGAVVDWFVQLPGRIWQAVKDAATWLYETGKNIIMGLINGIKDMFKKIISAITDTVSGAINAAKQGLGIASPSKVFAEIGRNVGLGLANGIEQMVPAVTSAGEALANAAQVEAFGTADVFGTANTSGTGPGGVPVGGVVVQQTNMMQPGTDVKQFSDLVLGRGFGDFLSGASTLSVARNGVQAGVNDQWVGVT